jgi:predicted DNA-binding transcriptional regulator AlpA
MGERSEMPRAPRVMSIKHRHEALSTDRQQAARSRDLTEQSARKLRRIPEIVARLGICRMTWARWLAAGQAPAPVPNVPGFPRWRLKDIEDFENGAYGRVGTSGLRGVFSGMHERRAARRTAQRPPEAVECRNGRSNAWAAPHASFA